MTLTATVDCIAIPDGFVEADGVRKLRISVVLRPHPDAAGPVSIADWPAEIAALDFRIMVGSRRDTLETLTEAARPDFAGAGQLDLTAAAQAWWKDKLWKEPQVLGAYAALMTPGKPRKPARAEAYSYSQVIGIARDAHESAVAATLLASGLSGSAGAPALSFEELRRRDPNSPAVQIRVAQELAERDVFQGLSNGSAADALKNNIGASTLEIGIGGIVERAEIDALDATFITVRAAITKAAQGKAADGSAAWNPFLPAQVAGSSKSEWFSEAVFGPRRAPAECVALGPWNPVQDVAPSLAKLGVVAFDRAMASDDQLARMHASNGGTVSPQAANPNLSKPVIDDAMAMEIAQRHVAGLQAHPALRKFVRLLVDIEIPLDQFPEAFRKDGMHTGFVSVDVAGAQGSMRGHLTAFQLQNSDDPSLRLFEPAPQYVMDNNASVSAVPSLPLAQGVVRLRDSRAFAGASEPRFRIEVIDGIAGMTSRRRALQATLSAIANGVDEASVPHGEPGLRTAGLMLLDTEAIVPMHMREMRAAEPPPELGDIVLHYAEDLVDGYRVDLVSPKGNLYPAGARTLRYDVIEAALQAPQPIVPPAAAAAPGPAAAPAAAAAYPFAPFERRDDGYITPMARVFTAPETDKSPEQDYLIASEVLLNWDGANIGMPLPHDYNPVAAPETPGDTRAAVRANLPCKISYDFVGGRPGPILRAGEAYRYLLRARKPNGSSVPLAVAQRLAVEHAIGAPGSGAYVFAPVEAAPAPVVLIDPNDLPGRGSLEALDGPSPQTIVLRRKESVVRYIVAPRTGFEEAERLGEFDPVLAGSEKAAQERAGRGAYRYLRREADKGNFPGARTGAAAAQGKPNYLLFDPLKAEDPRLEPFHVDSSICSIGTRLSPTRATSPFAVTRTSVGPGLEFWKRDAAAKRSRAQGFDPAAVVPVKIVFYASDDAAGSRVTRLPDAQIAVPGGTLAIPALQVNVAPSDTLRFELWTNRTARAVLAQPSFRSALAKARAAGGTSGAAHLAGADNGDAAAREDWWATLSSVMRMGPLSDVLAFDVSHAIETPDGSMLAIESLQSAAMANEDTFLASVGAGGLLAGERGANAVFSKGKILVDRQAMCAVWAQAMWREVTGKTRVFRTAAAEKPHHLDQPKLWDYRDDPVSFRLFGIDDLPAIDARLGEDRQAFRKRANLVDLEKDERGAPRALSAEFKCDVSRRMLVRLRCRSRFLTNNSDPESGIAEALTEAECRATLDRLKEDGWRDKFDAAELNTGLNAGRGTRWIVLQATRRPAPPSILRDKGAFYQRRVYQLPGANAKRLEHVYRCWLGQDWFDSGEGEMLAIVCRKPNSGPIKPWLRPQLSIWGGDMAAEPNARLGPDNAEPYFLSEDQFLGTAGKAFATMYQRDDDSSGTVQEEQEVQLALLRPKFDHGHGRWYCDIAVRDLGAFKIGLRLSLARYQRNALPRCRLSKTVRADGFMLHQPWTFSATASGDKVTVTATGPAYVKRAPMVTGLSGGIQEQLDTLPPRIVVELERLSASGQPLPVIDRLGQIVSVVSGDEAFSRVTQSRDLPNQLRWTLPLVIPKEEIGHGDGETRHAVRITVMSPHANSRASTALAEGERDQEGPLLYLPEPIVVRLDV